jgi:hypothetical protein
MLIPRLDILPAAQRRLWPELGTTTPEFALYRGTAIALRLGHRASADFDFVGSAPFDPDHLLAAVPYLAGARVLQREENTLTCLLTRGGPVQVSFFGLPTIGRIEAPTPVEGQRFPVASLIDLAGMKAAVLQKRAQAKDYIDIDALIAAGVALPSALAAGRAIYGKAFEPQITVKALTYSATATCPRCRHKCSDGLWLPRRRSISTPCPQSAFSGDPHEATAEQP